MQLADLAYAMELEAQLKTLDDWLGGFAKLVVDGPEGETRLPLSAEELAEFVEWRRGKINAELRRLGIDTSAADGLITTETVRQRETALEAAAPSHRLAVSVVNDPAPPLTREEATKKAREIVLAPWFHDNGFHSRDEGMADEVKADLARYEERRRPEIRALAEELLNPPETPRCAVCGGPATTVVAGEHYCNADLASVKRPQPPPQVVVH